MNARTFLLPSLAVTLLAALLGPTFAGEDEAAGVVRFYRVFTPEDRINDWPRGDAKYLPVDATEFGRLVEGLRPRPTDAPATPPAAIVSTRYEAKLVGDQLVGRAVADVILTSPTPAMLAFEPCNLALRNVEWNTEKLLPSPARERGGDGEPLLPDSKTSGHVALGLGSAGRLEAMVDRSAQWRFDWSLAGRRDSADILGFSFEAPRAPANRLSIELPKGFTPVIDRGIVVGSEPAGEGARLWQIELGGCHRFRLRVLPSGVASQRPQLALLRESRTYDFSLRGVEVAAQWKLQVHNEPLQQITVLLDPELHLVSARYGDTLLSWSTTTSAGGRATRVVLALPEPIRDVERVVRLDAVARLRLDQPWRLPRIRSESLFWQEGSITLLTPEPLVADRIVPSGCGQTDTGPLSSPRAGESVQFQSFEPGATVEVLLTRRPSAVQMLSATAVKVGSDEVTARVAADFHANEGTRFALEADVSSHWIIDAVESVPPGAVADWTLEPNGRGQRLAIRLQGGLSPIAPLRLVIAARRIRSSALPLLAIDDLSPLQFRAMAGVRQLVAVQPAGLYALKLTGVEQLARLNAESLTPAESQLFAEPPQDLLFERDARANGLTISLVGQKPKYSGTIEVDATVGDRVLREKCLLRCVPESSRLDRVLVQFFPRGKAAPCWTLGGENAGQLVARKWSAGEQAAAGVDSSLETWELTFRRPRSAPFEITASRVSATSTGNTPQTLTLASLPEAASQWGTLVVRSVTPQALNIENRRLKPMLPEPTPADRVSSVRAAYRYDPARDVVAGAAAAIRVSAKPAPNTARAWVWNCRLESWYQSDGAARHEATYYLQSAGQATLRWTLPPNVARKNIRGIWIDGDPVEWQLAATAGASHIAVALPAGRKFPSVMIQWTDSEPRMGMIGSRTPPLPEPDLPVLARRWTVWLPPGYESCGSGVGGTQWTWSHRLFGPLGRAAGVNRFDPLSPSNWLKPLADLGNDGQAVGTAAAASDTPGWTAWRTDIAAGTPVRLEYVHAASLQLLGLIVLLVTVALGCWKAGDRPMLLVSLLGFLGAAALVLPGVYTPIASGGVLGIAFCLIWRMLYRRVSPSVDDETVAGPRPTLSPDSTVSMVMTLGRLLLLTALLAGGVVARGEDRPEGADKSPEKQAAVSLPYRVLVPIDAQKKPVGGKVYVPEPLYQELYRRAAAPAEKPQGWLIQRATYQGDLAPEAGGGRLVVDTLRAEYDLRVFGPATRVRIPLRTEGANLIPNGVLLDGRAIQSEWEPGGAALAVEVAEPGEYRLEVSLRPAIRSGRGSASFDVAIPRVANASFELTLPEETPLVEVPSACGAVRVKKDPARLLADLGPADRLTVRWQEDAASSTAEPAVDVEQFVWLKFQPGSVVIATKFKLHILEGQVQQVRLTADPRLRLLPLPGDDPPSVQTRSQTGESRLIAFRWSRPLADQSTLEATFLLSGALGVGNFRLPQIELLDARSTKRWMAVSVDAALDHEEQQKQRLESVTVSDFVKAWGAADAKPQAAYRLPAGEIDWNISTRPHESSSSADQTLTLSYDVDHVDLVFEAQLSTDSGYLFQHQLMAPKGLKIEDVSLLEAGVERASRWSQDAGGRVTIFLNGPASGEQKLVLHGQLPIGAGKPRPLPEVRLERCQLRSAIVRLFRRPSVTLTVQGGARTAVETPPDDANTLDMGQFVEAFSWDATQPLPVSVAIEHSRPARAPVLADAPTAASKASGKASIRADRGPAVTAAGAGLVRLADVTLAWQTDGSCYGTSRFDLEPAGAGECPLHLPSGYELVQVSVEGISVTPRAVGSGEWRFALASQRWPQRIDVVFRGAVPAADRRGFETPTLGDLPVRQTLWTLIGPASWAANETDGVTTIQPWRQELLRLKGAAAAIETARAKALSDSSETSRWHTLWTQRLMISHAALLRELAAAGASKETGRAKCEADAIEQRNAELAKQLGTVEALTPILPAGPAAQSPGEMLQHSLGAARPVVRCSFEGRANRLTLDGSAAGREWFTFHLVAAAALLALVFLSTMGAVRAALTKNLRRWPHAPGVVLGLVWWLWLSPSVFGLGIALASVLAAGRARMAAKRRALTGC